MLSTKKAREEAGMTLLTPAKARLESAGIPFDAHVRNGNPAEVITGFSGEYHCDLIVMGTRGMGTINLNSSVRSFQWPKKVEGNR
jgi:nucleotide-binding universal stress UspA family protein